MCTYVGKSLQTRPFSGLSQSKNLLDSNQKSLWVRCHKRIFFVATLRYPRACRSPSMLRSTVCQRPVAKHVRSFSLIHQSRCGNPALPPFSHVCISQRPCSYLYAWVVAPLLASTVRAKLVGVFLLRRLSHRRQRVSGMCRYSWSRHPHGRGCHQALAGDSLTHSLSALRTRRSVPALVSGSRVSVLHRSTKASRSLLSLTWILLPPPPPPPLCPLSPSLIQRGGSR